MVSGVRTSLGEARMSNALLKASRYIKELSMHCFVHREFDALSKALGILGYISMLYVKLWKLAFKKSSPLHKYAKKVKEMGRNKVR